MSENNIREEVAMKIAEKYVELDEIAKDAGIYGAIRLDYARYGEGSPDTLLRGFLAGLREFDEKLSGAMNDSEYTSNALANIMDENDMDEEQRTRFLYVMSMYAEQKEPEQIREILDGGNEDVLHAFVLLSKGAGAVTGGGKTEEQLMAEICGAAQRNAFTDEELRAIDGDAGDELLRCYCTYCVLRDGSGEAFSDAGCGKFIGSAVRAGERRAEVINDVSQGGMNGERAAEILRAITEILLITLALTVSVGLGSYAALSVIHLTGILVGFDGILGTVALILSMLAALPAGITVGIEAVKLCAKAGLWLEKNALEPCTEGLGKAFDGIGHWFAETATPEIRKAFDGLKGFGEGAVNGAVGAWNSIQPKISDAVSGAVSGVKEFGEGAVNGAVGAWNSIQPKINDAVSGAVEGAKGMWNGMQPALEKAGDDALRWMDSASIELGSAIGKLLRAFNFDDGDEN